MMGRICNASITDGEECVLKLRREVPILCLLLQSLELAIAGHVGMPWHWCH